MSPSYRDVQKNLDKARHKVAACVHRTSVGVFRETADMARKSYQAAVPVAIVTQGVSGRSIATGVAGYVVLRQSEKVAQRLSRWSARRTQESVRRLKQIERGGPDRKDRRR